MKESKWDDGKLIKVLVVESDKDLRNILKELFELEGYEFLILAKSVSVMEQVQCFKPDVVLIDYRLPLINGAAICQTLKQHPSTRQVPVIIYSASPMSQILTLNVQFDAFLAKPFDLNELLRNIESLVISSTTN